MADSSQSRIQQAAFRVKGLVQGVGYRPFVWQLAHQYDLRGWVKNDAEGVWAEVSGEAGAIESFAADLQQQAPPLAQVTSVKQEVVSDANLSDATDFQIVASEDGQMQTGVVPDAATCPECLQEVMGDVMGDVMDENNRRYHYAFTNCTHCGPRYSIIQGIPYDRPQTSMQAFEMCPSCQQEYDSPADRRFHAQPNACGDCGPQLRYATELLGEFEEQDLSSDAILQRAVSDLQAGRILAIKGLGGYHLVCDAHSSKAVETLRQRKHRPSKPFALMAKDVETIQQYVTVSKQAKSRLQSSAAPILILPKRKIASDVKPLADDIAPNQQHLGLMLPFTPLHHILLQAFDGVLVFTSANLSGQPQIYQDDVAQQSLPSLIHGLLWHDREIVRRLEDSVEKALPEQDWVADLPAIQTMRMGRGLTPKRLTLPKGFEDLDGVMAAGADLKSTLAIAKQGEAVLSQYLADLANFECHQAYQQAWQDLHTLYQLETKVVVCDQHPDYFSHQWAIQQANQQAESKPIDVIEIGHHHAHLAACLADNQLAKDTPKVLGLVLDGLGFADQSIWQEGQPSLWGGEALYGDYAEVVRVGCLKPVSLLGGEQAMKQPWRNLFAQLLETGLSVEEMQHRWRNLPEMQALSTKPLALLEQSKQLGVNSPLSHSAGRLFDAFAALVTPHFERISYEGEAAIALENLLTKEVVARNLEQGYAFALTEQNGLLELDAAPVFIAALDDLLADVSAEDLAARFHLGLAQGLAELAASVHRQSPFQQLAWTGGVAQNAWLTILLARALQQSLPEVELLTHQTLPANDSNIALGQLLIYGARNL